MLGVAVEDLNTINYPIYASMKLDGVRAIWDGEKLLSRTLKPIPNRALQQQFRELSPPAWWDGELIVGNPFDKAVYRKTVSSVMTYEGLAEAHWYVFDSIVEAPFSQRLLQLNTLPPLVHKLTQYELHNAEEVLKLEQEALEVGYEGLILRNPNALYKNGRSTLREQGMLKVKRFTDAEAIVIGFEELMHNANEAQLDERGYTKRSSHQENKVGRQTLGALVCDYEGRVFRVGTGFTAEERQHIWDNTALYKGKLVKFKSLSIGVKDSPRHPVWLGWRDELDV